MIYQEIEVDNIFHMVCYFTPVTSKSELLLKVDAPTYVAQNKENVCIFASENVKQAIKYWDSRLFDTKNMFLLSRDRWHLEASIAFVKLQQYVGSFKTNYIATNNMGDIL